MSIPSVDTSHRYYHLATPRRSLAVDGRNHLSVLGTCSTGDPLYSARARPRVGSRADSDPFGHPSAAPTVASSSYAAGEGILALDRKGNQAVTNAPSPARSGVIRRSVNCRRDFPPDRGRRRASQCTGSANFAACEKVVDCGAHAVAQVALIGTKLCHRIAKTERWCI